MTTIKFCRILLRVVLFMLLDKTHDTNTHCRWRRNILLTFSTFINIKQTCCLLWILHRTWLNVERFVRSPIRGTILFYTTHNFPAIQWALIRIQFWGVSREIKREKLVVISGQLLIFTLYFARRRKNELFCRKKTILKDLNPWKASLKGKYI